MKRTIEIRAAEGGDDAKLFVSDLMDSYVKLSTKFGWKALDRSIWNGEENLAIEGKDLSKLYNESGGHRIQRVPPTERNGRVHTSTITVAIVDETKIPFTLNDKDIRIEWFSGTGAGGQHRNKVMNSCRMTHIPSKTVVTAQTRSRQNSLTEARTTLEQRLNEAHDKQSHSHTTSDRKKQVGSGERGDKIRTYRFQDDKVHDHNTGKIVSLKKVMSGNFDLLWW